MKLILQFGLAALLVAFLWLPRRWLKSIIAEELHILPNLTRQRQPHRHRPQFLTRMWTAPRHQQGVESCPPGLRENQPPKIIPPGLQQGRTSGRFTSRNCGQKQYHLDDA